MYKRSLILACALFLISGMAFAQFGGLLGKKNSDGGNEPKVDVNAAMAQGSDMIGYLTIATDQGVMAVETLLEMYPPEKVEKIKKMSMQYNEAKAKRQDGNIDAEQFRMAGDIGKEMSAMEGDWQTYKKEKAQTVRKADSRLGLMLLADGLAATKAPDTINALQNAIKSIGSNPMNAGNAGKLKKMVSILTVVTTELPNQVGSYKTVRKITKSIAEAEKVQLPADPPANSVKDKQAIQSKSSELDA